MTKKIIFITCLILCFISLGCGGTHRSNGGIQVESTFINGQNYIIQNNLNGIQGILSVENTKVYPPPSDGLMAFAIQPSANKKEIELYITASLDTPKIANVALQATDIKFKGDYVFISYNNVGDDYRGAVLVLKLEGNKLTAISELKLNDTEVHSLDVEGENLILVGAKDDEENLTSPAYVSLVKLNGDNQIVSVEQTIDLPSFAAVGVVIDFFSNSFAVAYGDLGGGISILDMDGNILQSISLEDVRSLSLNQNKLFVLTGQPATLQIYDFSSLTFENKFIYSGLNQLHSKAVIQSENDTSVLSLGLDGTIIIENSTGAIIHQENLPDTGTDVVVNGVTFMDGYLFIAQGGGGLQMIKFDANVSDLNSNDLFTIIAEGQIPLPDSSVNMVRFNGKFLFIAGGLGGVKVIRKIDLSEDSDGDGVPDLLEDTNGDGNLDNDDNDGDGIPDYLDNDDDNDSIFTINEDTDLDGDILNDDDNGNGIPNYLENDGVNITVICHIPVGQVSTNQTITIANSAIPLHLNHGDSIGACP